MSKSKVRVLLIMAIVLSLSLSSVWAMDIEGHWAESQMLRWYDREVIKGYGEVEGFSLKPDNKITRAEFAVIVNKIFGFDEDSPKTFIDVKSSDWFYNQVNNSTVYMSGYPDGTYRPNNNLTREEATVVLSKVFELKTQGYNDFKDSNEISSWSEDAVNTMVSKNYLSGYPDKTFKPSNTITRAEVITIIDKMVDNLVTKDTTLSAKGNVVINTADVKLSNSTIDGDLYITEGVGEGDVVLDTVTVKGRTLIAGGGPNSVIVRNSDLGEVQVLKRNGKEVRIVVENSNVGTLTTLSATTLVVEDSTIETIKVETPNLSITTDDKSKVNVDVANYDYTMNGEKIDKGESKTQDDKKDDSKTTGGGDGSSSGGNNKPEPEKPEPEKPETPEVKGSVTFEVTELVEGLTSEFTLKTDMDRVTHYTLHLDDETQIHGFTPIDQGMKHLNLVFKDVEGMYVKLYKGPGEYSRGYMGKAYLHNDNTTTLTLLEGTYEIEDVVEGLTSKITVTSKDMDSAYVSVNDKDTGLIIVEGNQDEIDLKALTILLKDPSKIRIYLTADGDFTFADLLDNGKLLF